MRSIIILRGKIRADKERAKRSIVVAMNERVEVSTTGMCPRIVGERRGKRGTNVLSTEGERARRTRGIAFFDSRCWALES